MINRYDVSHMEVFLYSQAEAVIAQYEIEIKQIAKGRGCYICDSDRGRLVLSGWSASKERGRWLRDYLKAVQDAGISIEQIQSNRSGEAVTVDEMSGEAFLLKDYVQGTEISPSRWGEMIEAVQVLGDYHRTAEQVVTECPDVGWNTNVTEVRGRHFRELLKVRNYIRAKKKKMDFERIYMQYVAQMLQTAERSVQILEQEEKNHPRKLIGHGDVNHHNLVWTQSGFRMIHFENASYTWGVADLANYMRKMLEKNGWDEELGAEIIRSYESARPLEEAEYRQLQGLLLFPEKFWKLTNHYMNSSKVWIPEKDIEKLNKVIRQEEKRLIFAENLFSILK